jgi:hypothetical protein
MYSKPTLSRFGTFRELTQSLTPLGNADTGFHTVPPPPPPRS